VIDAGGKACGAGTTIGLGPAMPSKVFFGTAAGAARGCAGGAKGVSPTGGAWLTGAG
jgi:hypothetical protein